MKKVFLKYKGFLGSVNYDAIDKIFYGKVEGINHLITYEGNTFQELKSAFRWMLSEHINDTKIYPL
jgi:predicted HicB family RNase H-like nuclease